MVAEPKLMPVTFGCATGAVAPPGMNTVGGAIVALVESLLLKATTTPFSGAGTVRFTGNGKDRLGPTVRLPARLIAPEEAARFVSVKTAGFATPAADAVTLYVPPSAFAVSVWDLATPDASVTAVFTPPAKVTPGPLPGGVNVTERHGRSAVLLREQGRRSGIDCDFAQRFGALAGNACAGVGSAPAAHGRGPAATPLHCDLRPGRLQPDVLLRVAAAEHRGGDLSQVRRGSLAGGGLHHPEGDITERRDDPANSVGENHGAVQRAGGDRIAAELLGTGIERGCGAIRCQSARPVLGLDLGDAEVEQLGNAGFRHQDVRRLQVAMDDPFPVRVADRVTDDGEELQPVRDRLPSLPAELVDELALDKFHRAIRQAIRRGSAV